MPSFAIVCIGRVGSEHLVSLLDSHPEITCFSELFVPDWAAPWRRGTLNISPFAEAQHESPMSYWNELTDGLDTPIVGLKLPGSSIKAHPDAVELIADAEVQIIRLSRRNRLAQYVSVWLAMESGVWHSTQGAYGNRTINVDVDECLSGLDHIAQQEAELDDFTRGHRVFGLSYEELTAGERIGELQSFLDAEPRELTSRYERLRGRPLDEVIENYDELATALAGTPHATYLGEPAQ